ncbi:MAG: HAD family hydrolase [Clostridiales bacterium]|nr:HAD family hydrolase [Clostridiales bacterium]
MEKYSTIIWDMDGTLLDTLDDLSDSVNEALFKFSQPLRTKQEIRSFVGNGVLRLLELSVPDGKNNPLFDDIFEYFKLCYEKNQSNKTKPYEGLDILLPRLLAGGYKMAIVSNKIDPAVKDLANLHFPRLMQAAIGEQAGMKRKPADDMVNEALRLLGSSKQEAIYIGDTEVDIETAKNSRLDFVCVSWGFRDRKQLEDAGAEKIFDRAEELLEFFKV